MLSNFQIKVLVKDIKTLFKPCIIQQVTAAVWHTTDLILIQL